MTVAQRLSVLVLTIKGAGTLAAHEDASLPALVELVVMPATIQLPDSRSRQQLVVTGKGVDGWSYDLTRRVRYHVEDAGVVQVDAMGVVWPLRAGTTALHISDSGRSVRVPVHVGAAAPAVSFRNEVMAVLGKAGCNTGACHGHASGKGGFKLSLRGYNPAADHDALTRQHFGRRVNLVDPAASLLLRKASGLLEHGGGQRFGVASESFQLLLQWLREGASGNGESGPRLDHITVIPEMRIVPRPGLKQQLVVFAHYSDGEVRDVSDRAIYELTTEGVLDVAPRGLATARQVGDAPVLVRFLGKMAVSRLTVINARAEFVWRSPPERNFIDGHVFAKLKAVQVLPAELSTDTEFLRRVSFDTIGLPPTPGEVRAFLADSRPDKRSRKIDELLDRPEFADQWALYWLDLLRADESAAVMGRKGVWTLSRWLRQAVADNMPYDQFVRAFSTALGSQFANPPAAFSRVFRQPHEKAEAFAQIFLGTRLECAQCHDHPFDRWTQENYNALVSFFYQVRRKDGPDYYDEAQIFLEPERNRQVHLRFLDGSEVDWSCDRDRRQALADWLFGPAKKWTARALTNRVWGKLLGRGIVEPVDDLRFSNPPVNEPLLDSLADDFIANGYDFKGLVRTILNSRTYQLSSWPNPLNTGEQTSFAHARMRRLSAEQLLDALSQATGIEEEYNAPAGFRAAQVATNNTGSYFLKVFGRPLRKTVCTCERSHTPTLPQTLHLMNGSTMMKRLAAEGGTLRRLLKDVLADDPLIDELYLHALSRHATPAELSNGRRYLSAAGDRAEGAEDLFWALLNSKQFSFNH